MRDLIERLIKSAGPDRELDYAISVADFDPPFVENSTVYPPRYTESLDAARTLIPSGFYWLVSEGRTRDTEPLGGAQVFRPNYLVEPVAEAEHESAIIALCIAALKARETAHVD